MIQKTRAWIETMVIGLNLCPFAEKVFNANTIRYVISQATTPESLLKDLEAELQILVSSPRTKIETTLLIHPDTLSDFLDFNDFIYEAESLVGTLGLSGTVQIAGFHPKYQFEGTTRDAPENYSNRSPYPTLHLLREISITEVAASPKDLLEIPERNIQTLKALGTEAIQKMLSGLKTAKEDGF